MKTGDAKVDSMESHDPFKTEATVVVMYDMVLVTAGALVSGGKRVHSSSGIRLPTGAENDVLTNDCFVHEVNPMNERGVHGIHCPSKNTIGTRPA